MLIDQLNVVDCSSGASKGAGLAGCKKDMKRVTTIGLLQKGYRFPLTGVTKALLLLLIKKGTLKILKGVENFEDTTAEHSYETVAGSGIKKLILKNPYEYNASFDNGIDFNKALNSIAGKGQFDLILWDVEDQMWVTQTKSGDVKGFDLGIHEAGNYKGNDGTKASSQMLTFQLNDRGEIDDRIANILAVDYSPTELDDFNDVLLTINPVAPLATTLVAKAMLNDKSHFADGLVNTNFRLKKNGNVIAISPSQVVADSSAKTYTFTITAAAVNDVYTLETYDSTDQTNVILNPLGFLYKSNLATVTVI
ncbi:MAG: hypothetical protein LH615_04095 [Ferruginibacter sp.]|nr:hypothetical protein [Ferruginibacter sp.]